MAFVAPAAAAAGSWLTGGGVGGAVGSALASGAIGAASSKLQGGSAFEGAGRGALGSVTGGITDGLLKSRPEASETETLEIDSPPPLPAGSRGPQRFDAQIDPIALSLDEQIKKILEQQQLNI